MALTIAVGFVVDDAIVMLENIYRHIEAGLSPLEATLKGAGEIGFTILSISISLVAVFIPLLLMSGIVGRLFREFAVTVTMTIAVSAFVALTLSPMMCVAVPARREACAARPALHDARARLRAAARALHARPRLRAAPPARHADRVPRHGGHRGAALRRRSPRASSRSRTPASSSASPMRRRTSRSTRWCACEQPADVRDRQGSGGRELGARSSAAAAPLNNGFVVLGLKPRDRARRQRRSGHQPPAGASSPRCPAARCSCRRRRT